MKPTFLFYPPCSTCVKAKNWLKSKRIDADFRDIVTQNPSRDELVEWIEKSGLPILKFFNTSGLVYKELNLKDRVKSAGFEELVDLLASNGKLVKRPIMVKDQTVLVGFNENEWASKI